MSAGPELRVMRGPASQNTTREAQYVPLSGIWVVITSKAATVHMYDRVQETKTTPKVRQCPARVKRRVESEDVTFLALRGGYMMDIHSFYLCRPPITLDVTISTHLWRLLKERSAYYVFRSTLRALRRLSCPICAMNDQPEQDTGCDGVVTYLPFTNAPDKRDRPIEQRREVRRCPVHVTRKVDCKDAVFLALRGVT
jgi:hypothetical protein